MIETTAAPKVPEPAVSCDEITKLVPEYEMMYPAMYLAGLAVAATRTYWPTANAHPESTTKVLVPIAIVTAGNAGTADDILGSGP
jgi:hypothetical protein